MRTHLKNQVLAKAKPHFFFLFVAISYFPYIAKANIGSLLEGSAQIIQSISPMIVAGQRAKADVEIARINSSASLQMAEIQANTSKFLANLQAETSLYQMMTNAIIQYENQKGITDRLKLEIEERTAARKDNLAFQREQFLIDAAFRWQQLELAKQQADLNVKLAQANLRAELVKAELSSGLKTIDSTHNMISTPLSFLSFYPIPSQQKVSLFKESGFGAKTFSLEKALFSPIQEKRRDPISEQQRHRIEQKAQFRLINSVHDKNTKSQPTLSPRTTSNFKMVSQSEIASSFSRDQEKKRENKNTDSIPFSRKSKLSPFPSLSHQPISEKEDSWKNLNFSASSP